MNVEKVIEQLVLNESKEIDQIQFLIERSFDGDFIRKNIHIQDKGNSSNFSEKVQALRYTDFEHLLTSNGFEIIDTFGDFALGSFDAKLSDRLIIIAKKNK